MTTALMPLADTTPAMPAEAVDELSDELSTGLRRIDAACAQACASIAPAWPLDQSIAVNPHWQRIGLPLRSAAARMALLGGIQLLPSRERQRAAWATARIGPADLTEALHAVPAAAAAGLSARDCLDRLHAPAALERLPLLIDLLDDDPRRHQRLSYREAITYQVSQCCAAYFDRQQADWRPHAGTGLYAFWMETLRHDHGIGLLMGLPELARGLRALPPSRAEAEAWVLHKLGLPEAVWADYLEAVLLTVLGWASYCAWQGWQARHAGETDEHLRDLLAIRLAWGAVLLDCKPEAAARRSLAALQQHWAEAPQRLHEAEQELLVDEVWQAALEAGYQRELAQRLAVAPGQPPEPPPASVQAVFCIDVRSEPMRRALEAVDPTVRTVGFAGFFGVPAAYTPLGTAARRPQLPGLLAPQMELQDQVTHRGAEPVDATLQQVVAQARQRRFAQAEPWQAATRWPGAAFSSVEAAGLGYLGSLAGLLRPGTGRRVNTEHTGLAARWRSLCRPALVGLDLPARTALAAGVLKSMGLVEGFAPLVVLVGHGSQSANNAHAAALDCGACCGQTGEVNARSLARLLNDPALREGLRSQGVALPDGTAFVAALHNTTTDEVEGFDLDLLSPSAQAAWAHFEASLRQAGDQVRRERAPLLGMDPRTPHAALLAQLRRRANDPAQTRPEWGLAGNAALVLAPRHRTRGVVLSGRSFLHDYDPAQDADGSLLESLMTAPMLVAHWINWQYHASTCEPARLGAGNKLLHNVVGGRIGVFEGNGGDLRIGLSRQSLHDGARWVHEPLRLTVVIDAPAPAIERVLARHEAVRQLVAHGWLHLWRFDGAGLQRLAQGRWQAVQPAEPARRAGPH